jgi:hypothetical protein
MITVMRKDPMHSLSSLAMRFYGGFFRYKYPEVIFPTVRPNLRGPLSSQLVPPNTAYAGFVSDEHSRVMHIFRLIGLAEIFPAIVNRIAVYVINLICWPLSSHVRPNQSMCSYFLAHEGNYYPALAAGANRTIPGYIARSDSIRIADLPSYDPRIRTICEAVPQHRWVDIIKTVYFYHSSILKDPSAFFKVGAIK